MECTRFNSLLPCTLCDLWTSIPSGCQIPSFQSNHTKHTHWAKRVHTWRPGSLQLCLMYLLGFNRQNSPLSVHSAKPTPLKAGQQPTACRTWGSVPKCHGFWQHMVMAHQSGTLMERVPCLYPPQLDGTGSSRDVGGQVLMRDWIQPELGHSAHPPPKHFAKPWFKECQEVRNCTGLGWRIAHCGCKRS